MFREIILKIKTKTGLSTRKLSDELGVSFNVLDNLLCERYGQSEPKFSDGVAIIVMAGEVGVNVHR